MKSFFAVLALLVVAACGSGGGGGGGFSNVSQLDAIWTLNGTYSFNCGGVAEHQIISGAKVYVFGGAFYEKALALPSAICGFGSLTFRGNIDLSGNITGTVVTNGGNPPLSDTLSATCTATSCQGGTANTSNLTFTMTKTAETPFDGTWSRPDLSFGPGISVVCSNNQFVFAFNLSVSGGSFSSSGNSVSPTAYCTAAGSASQPSSTTVNGTIDNHGNLTATVTQPPGDSLSFSGQLTSLTGGSVSGTYGATLSMSRLQP
jgi:hypothetical protein